MFNSLNWNIDRSNLPNYKEEGWTEHYFVVTPDSRFGIVVYNIEEWRMLSYGGLIAIFSCPENPKLELSSTNTWIWFSGEDTFSFLDISGCIAFRKPIFDSSKEGFPFVIFDIKGGQLAFVEFDGTSIYYGLKEIEKGKIQIVEVHPADLDRLNPCRKRTNEIVELSTLKWFDSAEFDKILDFYNG